MGECVSNNTFTYIQRKPSYMDNVGVSLLKRCPNFRGLIDSRTEFEVRRGLHNIREVSLFEGCPMLYNISAPTPHAF